jgi:hypothetical protein
MKKILIFAIAIMTVAAIPFHANAQDQKVKGDGNVTSQDRTVPTFSKISVDGFFNVHLTQGDQEKVTVEADDNIQQYVETTVDNGDLHVGFQKHISLGDVKKMDVYITLKNISDLDISGVGNVSTTAAMKLSVLNIENSGVGNINLELNCDELTATNSSVGNLTLKGSIQTLNIDHSGVGNVKAYDAIAQIVNVKSDAVGNVEVDAEKEINVTSSGVGNVRIKGAGVIKELHKDGLGSVEKV